MSEPSVPKEAHFPVVELVDLGRTFTGASEVHALDGVDLSVDAGEFLAVVGPSGSGKSTLLHLLGLLDRPSRGVYRLDGIDTQTLGERDRTAMRGQRIGFVFQSFHLLAHRSVTENVMTGMLYQRVPRSQRRQRSLDALDRVGMAHRADFTPSTLSGGERQRVAVARALAARPSMLLCDEPTGNLDSANSNAMLSLFEELHHEGQTVVLITHDSAVSERARRVVRIHDGHLSEAV